LLTTNNPTQVDSGENIDGGRELVRHHDSAVKAAEMVKHTVFDHFGLYLTNLQNCD
jgi:hypothetical protein